MKSLSKTYLLSAVILAALAVLAINCSTANKSATAVIDVRAYNLKPGTGKEYHQVVEEFAMPMLKRWKMDVLAYGPSKSNPDSYYFIRAFKSLDDLKKREEAFYGSDEWKNGPNDTISYYIVNYTSFVVNADEEMIKQLRKLAAQ